MYSFLIAVILFSFGYLVFVKEKIDKKDLFRLALCGVFGVAINQLLFFEGLNLTTPINGVLPDFSYANAKDTSNANADASYLIHFQYNAISNSAYDYIVSIRGLDYVVQSKENLKFYNVKSVKVTDNSTKAV